MNCYGSPLPGEHLKALGVEADKKSVLQLGGVQSAITELAYTQGFAQESQVA